MSKKKSNKPAELSTQGKIDNALKSGDSAYLIGVLSKSSMRGLVKVEDLATKIIEFYPKEQSKIFTLLLTRVGSLKKQENIDSTKKLYADIMFHQAQFIIEQYAAETKPGVKAEHYTQAIALLNSANILVQTNELGLKITPEEEISKLLKSYKSANVEGSDKQAFEFAKKSLTHQQSKLPEDHPSILSALLAIAKVGDEVTDNSAKLEALNYAKEAYNMAIRNHDVDSTVTALRLEAEIYRFYGDEALATSLSQQAETLKPIEEKHSPEDAIKHENIIVHNELNKDVLAIKLQIQETILNPIRKAAANGKWIDIQPLQGNLGVFGYLSDYLEMQLEELNTEQNTIIALKLCFEAINLGIMSSKEQNPLCAKIFVQEYPEIVKQTLAENPEYFVDGFIVRTSIIDAHKYAESILGSKVASNTDDYNAHFEQAIMPIVTARLQKPILDSITKIISSGTWNEGTKNELLKLVSEHHLTTSSIFNSHLGKNLGAAHDMLNIVRILAFKTLVEEIVKTNSTNYAPVSDFVQAYPEIIIRINKDHPEYFIKNDTIIDICEKTPEAVAFCNETIAKIAKYKETANKYAKNVQKLLLDSEKALEEINALKTEIDKVTNEEKGASITTYQEEAVESLKVLNISAKETESILNQINIVAETAEASVFKASKEDIDAIFVKMDAFLDTAKASLNQALKPSQSIKEGCELIIAITGDLTVPESASGAEVEIEAEVVTLLAGEGVTYE